MGIIDKDGAMYLATGVDTTGLLEGKREVLEMLTSLMRETVSLNVFSGVELAAAIHYVFDTPDDRLVWDVGHQAYAHKIITGRREAFRTNRKLGGISGFPRIAESLFRDRRARCDRNL